ncbi:MAG: N-acetylmuramoyl-L-alanine amidase, partial [Elusimicrobia bacterium]|nr:N-acetylmuramoyl-L-alanine amidase [Elusimicrobiota bacterium]
MSHLLSSRSATHFIVCRDGQVTRMVRIEDIAIHVKNRAIDDASVGIETESGSPAPPYFIHGDWDPILYWRMYASIAWLVRAVAKETALPRDRAHIITHREADLGIPGAHVDPGPDFDGTADPAAPGAPAVPYDALSLRFPGENV